MSNDQGTSHLLPLVIGIGNDMRGDDGVGPEVVRRLSEHKPTCVDVCCAEDDALALIEAWQAREVVIMVDAMQSERPPGDVQFLDATQGPLNSIMNDVSSHGLGLGHSLELARSLGKMPEYCRLFVVEGKDFSIGAGISPEVERMIPEIVRQIQCEVEKLTTE